jgi:hypothetical protein
VLPVSHADAPAHITRFAADRRDSRRSNNPKSVSRKGRSEELGGGTRREHRLNQSPRPTTPRISLFTIPAHCRLKRNNQRPTTRWCVCPSAVAENGSGVEPPYRGHAAEAVVDIAITAFGRPIHSGGYDDDHNHSGAAEFPKATSLKSMRDMPCPQSPLRCRESRRPLYQLCRLSDRMSHPAAETKEGPGQCLAVQGLRQRTRRGRQITASAWHGHVPERDPTSSRLSHPRGHPFDRRHRG